MASIVINCTCRGKGAIESALFPLRYLDQLQVPVVYDNSGLHLNHTLNHREEIVCIKLSRNNFIMITISPVQMHTCK